jgi:UDP-N-acetylmuramoyl-tripeptide--D-alanyl-D-alanine ligase
MTAAIVSRLGNVLATNGNFHNDIGVPLTLLRLTQEHDFAVVEMGANHMGEIAYTCNLVKPDIAIINNIAAAHLEGFGDLCGVARAKGEIFSGLNSTGIAIYNRDTKYTNKWQWRLVDKNVRTFSCASLTENNNADCYSSNVILDENGCASFTLHTNIGQCVINLNIPGQHNVCNAVAAASIALAFEASLEDIKLGLAQMQPVKGRLNIHQLNDQFKLIDDSYNANVESSKAAAQLLSSYSGKKILILGDMGELGSEARRYHQEVGQYAASLPIDVLLSLGVLSQNASDAFRSIALNTKNDEDIENSQHFNDRDLLIKQLIAIIKPQLEANYDRALTILVKGSRSARMEQVIEDIKHWYKEQASNLINSTDNQKNKSEINTVSTQEGVK